MAGIRFNAPPNDNKIRHLPITSFPGSAHIPASYTSLGDGRFDESFLNSAGPHLHITTPKRVRKISHIPNWSMFIAPELKDAMAVGSVSSQSSGSTDNMQNPLKKTESGHSEDFDINDNNKRNAIDKNGNSLIDATHTEPIFSKVEEFANDKVDSEDKILFEPSNNVSKCPVMKFYNTFGGDASCDELCDVLEDETSDLPAIPTPKIKSKLEGRAISKGILKNDIIERPKTLTPFVIRDTSRTVHDNGAVSGQPQAGNANKSPQSTNVQRSEMHTQLTELPVEEDEPEKSFFARQSNHSKGLSISSCPLEEKYESFFAAIDDTRHINNIPSSSLDSEILVESIPPRRKRSSHVTKKEAWNSDTTDTQKPVEQLPKEKKEQRKDTSTPVEDLKGEDDGPISPGLCRLKIRRFALADPERMIMSQTLRETLQKDIIKRRTSMVRKVSQFFNVKMGLNKEEDLI